MPSKFFATIILLIAFLAACATPTTAPTVTPSPTTAAIPTTLAQPTSQPSNHPTVIAKQPNILFLLTDDLDTASIPFMPKLKSLLIDQGVTLNNYFVSMSLCCPSRTTTLRGQYGHNSQILGNNLPAGGFEKVFQLGLEQSTIATWLQDAGYRTMLAGKYLNGYPQKNNLMYIPPGWTEWYSAMKGNAYSEFNYTLNENGKQVAYGNKPEDYGTDVYARKTVDFIQRSAKDGKPFFAYVAVYAPHGPSTPASRHEKLFLDAHVPRSPNFNEAVVNDKPGFIRNRPQLNPKQIAQLDEAYRKRLQSLQAVDEMIETLVNTLKQTGQLDNTYIFFTSDNGFHLGNHRQQTGKVAPYEEELRVSLIVRGPNVPTGKSLDHLTGNIDLAPTWAELAGAKAPAFVDGRSLVPLLGNTPPAMSAWRQCFAIENGLMQPPKRSSSASSASSNAVTELLEPPDQDDDTQAILPAAQRARLGVPDFRGIRTNDYSYVEYATGEKELYDLKADPYQLNNLAAKVDKNLLARLAARVKEMQTCQAASCRSSEDKPIE